MQLLYERDSLWNEWPWINQWTREWEKPLNILKPHEVQWANPATTAASAAKVDLSLACTSIILASETDESFFSLVLLSYHDGEQRDSEREVAIKETRMRKRSMRTKRRTPQSSLSLCIERVRGVNKTKRERERGHRSFEFIFCPPRLFPCRDELEFFPPTTIPSIPSKTPILLSCCTSTIPTYIFQFSSPN